jgi:hypothetical protein
MQLINTCNNDNTHNKTIHNNVQVCVYNKIIHIVVFYGMWLVVNKLV